MKKLKDLINNDKAVKIIVAAGFAVILLILLSDLIGFGSNNNTVKTLETEAESYTEQLEERLTDILSQIQGVGRVKVMITLETLEGTVPRVRGAAVVCDGGGDVFVRQKVIETVSKVLGISTARVSVAF